MDDLKIFSCGTDYKHLKGYEFSESRFKECYIFTFFKTDFISMTRDGIKQGKPYSYILYSPYTNVYHTNTPDAKTGFTDDWMYLKGKYVDQLISEMNILTDVIVPFYNKNTITAIINKIQLELSLNQIYKSMRIKTLITDLFIDLARNDHEDIFLLDYDEATIIRKVRKNVQKDFKRKWTLKNMADLSGFSSSYFLTLYKKYYKKSPIEDLLDYRIIQSKFMLESNTMSISEIASECGFNSLYYFSRVFQKKMGLSPTEYRKDFLKNFLYQ